LFKLFLTNHSYVSRLPFRGLEAEVSIAEKTMVTMEQYWLLGSSTPTMNIWGLLVLTIALPGNATERPQRVGPEVIYRCGRLRKGAFLWREEWCTVVISKCLIIVTNCSRIVE
jgi:hypothetical protein